MQILIPLILFIESKLINTDKIIKCLNTAENCQFSVFSTHWPSPKWHISYALVLLWWPLHACEVHETAKYPICNFENTKLPHCSFSAHFCRLHNRLLFYNILRMRGLGRRLQGLMLHLGQGQMYHCKKYCNVLMRQENITSVLTAHWNMIKLGIPLVAFH